MVEIGNRNKNESIYKGPYIINEINGLNVVLMDEKTKKTEIVHKIEFKNITHKTNKQNLLH